MTQTEAMCPRHRLASAGAVLLLAGCALGQPDPGGTPVTPPTSASSPASASSSRPTPTEPSTPTPRPTGVPGEVTDVATNLPAPWSVAVLPGGGALVSLRDEARVVRIAPDGSTTDVLAPGEGGRVPRVEPRGEGGLLGLALSPGFAGDGLVYAYSTTADGNEIMRMRLDDDTLATPEVLLSGIPAAGNHNGGRLAFGPDGMLYATTGDAGDGTSSQDLDSLGGKILRLTPDGAPAPGNPFEGSPVWSYGHRNVQGIGWDAEGRMFASEFGQNRLDELNLIEPGANYGWPQVEGGGGGEGLTDPLLTWTTDEASPSGIAVTGDAVYVTSLRGQRLWRVPLTADGVGEPADYLTGDLGRLRDVVTSAGGGLWVLTNNTSRGDPRQDDDRLVSVRLG